MPENKYLSLSFILFFKNRSGRVIRPSKWPGWTQKVAVTA
jgi:hypothetical protein